MKKMVKKQEGMLLVGAILGLFIIGAVVTGGIYYYNNKRVEDRGKLAGEQIRILGQAVDEYISINRNRITHLQSNNHLKCQSSGFCEITVAGLRDNGELPNTFSDKNAWGSEYKIQIKRAGVAPEYQITGVVVTTKSPNKPKMLGYALQTGGANAGNNLIDLTKISGTSGLWSYTNQDYPIISNQQYQLAYRVGYNASQYSPYVRRDGELPMTGDLQMAGHSIKNIDFLNANNESIQNSLNVGGKTNTNALQVNGNAEITGQLSGNLIPRQTAVAGQNCSPNGLVAKDETGALLSCVSGSWVSNSSSRNEMYSIRAIEKIRHGHRSSTGLRMIEINKTSVLLDLNRNFIQTANNIYNEKGTTESQIYLIMGRNLKKYECLFSNLPNKQCACGYNKIGVVINNTDTTLLISCEKLDVEQYKTFCESLPIKQYDNIIHKYTTPKENCRKAYQTILNTPDGFIGFIDKITTTMPKSGGPDGGGATENGPGGSKK